MAHDVFISYSNLNKATADAICVGLEAEGLRCWIAPRDIPPASNYGAEIDLAVEGAAVMVLVFSAGANTSRYVMREVEAALHYGKPILPFRLEDVPISRDLRFYLRSAQWLDATRPPLELNVVQLAKGVLHCLSPAAVAGATERKRLLTPAPEPPPVSGIALEVHDSASGPTYEYEPEFIPIKPPAPALETPHPVRIEREISKEPPLPPPTPFEPIPRQDPPPPEPPEKFQDWAVAAPPPIKLPFPWVPIACVGFLIFVIAIWFIPKHGSGNGGGNVKPKPTPIPGVDPNTFLPPVHDPIQPTSTDPNSLLNQPKDGRSKADEIVHPSAPKPQSSPSVTPGTLQPTSDFDSIYNETKKRIETPPAAEPNPNDNSQLNQPPSGASASTANEQLAALNIPADAKEAARLRSSQIQADAAARREEAEKQSAQLKADTLARRDEARKKSEQLQAADGQKAKSAREAAEAKLAFDQKAAQEAQLKLNQQKAEEARQKKFQESGSAAANIAYISNAPVLDTSPIYNPFNNFIELEQVSGRAVDWADVLDNSVAAIDPILYRGRISASVMIGIKFADAAISIKTKDAEALNDISKSLEVLFKQLDLGEGIGEFSSSIRQLAAQDDWAGVAYTLDGLMEHVRARLIGDSNRDMRAVVRATTWIQGMNYMAYTVEHYYNNKTLNLLLEQNITANLEKSLVATEVENDPLVRDLLVAIKKLETGFVMEPGQEVPVSRIHNIRIICDDFRTKAQESYKG